MRPQASPKRAPDYNLIRFVTVADSVPAGPPSGYRSKLLGCNFGGYMSGALQVVPVNTADAKLLNEPLGDLVTGATSNPALQIRFWNEDLQLYLVANPSQVIAAAGVGLAYEVPLSSVYGRMIFVEVTGGVTAGQGVLIFATGVEHYESL